jgi:glucose/arabinose dehydrogenase
MNFRMRVDYSLACTLLGTALACGDNGNTTADQTTTDTTSATPGTTTSTTPGTSTFDPTMPTDPSGTDTTNTVTGPGPTTTTTTGTTTIDPTGESTDDTTTSPPVCPYTPVDGMPAVELQEIANGFDRPVLAIPDPDQPDRLFVVEQGGHIKILEPGESVAPPDDQAFLFVDVENANANMIGPESGLLGFAFHPDFPADPRVYINYNPTTQGAGPTYIDEYTVDANDPNKVDPGTRRFVYAVGQPASNHNGGMINFGPDGYLYIGMGDGGGGGDEFETSRDPLSPHAKILRIDVEADGVPDSNIACMDCPMVDGFDFTVPPDNPFVGDPDYAPEVWATGLRNPWRFQFDSATGLLYAADVGQGQWEEVSIIEKGQDYGWNIMEGNNCFGGAPCDTSAGPNGVNADGMTAPITEFSHGNGRCSITGLGVYHSCEVPAWDGIYFYADYCSTEIFALRWDGTNVEEMDVVKVAGEPVIGSGYTGHGDILVTTVVVDNFNTIEDGKIYRIVPGA